MPNDSGSDLSGAFSGQKQPMNAPAAEEVPEQIKNHAPKPVLKPGGSWRARADAVDQSVRERQDANAAKRKWAERINTGAKRSKGFNRRARS